MFAAPLARDLISLKPRTEAASKVEKRTKSRGQDLAGDSNGSHVPRARIISFVTAAVTMMLVAHGRFNHGLNRPGKMLVLTSYGAGTWGAPMRVGTDSEIVLIGLDSAESQKNL
jgi:hypothetical protein